MPETARDESTRRRNAFHAQRFARATSSRERAHAAYDRARSAIAKLPTDAARDAAYVRLERLLDQFSTQVQDQGRK